MKGDSRLASSHLGIYISLFQPATASKNFIKLPMIKFLKQLLWVEKRIYISQERVCALLQQGFSLENFVAT